MADEEMNLDDEEQSQTKERNDLDGEEAAEGEELAAGGGSKKKLVLIALLLVILAAIPAALYFTGIIGGSAHEEADIPLDEAGNPLVDEDGKPLPPQQIIYYDLEEFIVNLNVGSKRPSFLKMILSLELPGEAQIPAIESKLPRIRDSFQVYLRELRLDDLQGSAGIYRLREELLLRINKIVYPAKVNDILFKQILVQ